MNKTEYLAALQKGLTGLPKNEIDERLSFYSEVIDDRIEEGLTEETAVAEIGTVEDVVMQMMSEIPFGKLVKERIKPKRSLSIWEIILLILGSPIWACVLLAVVATGFSLYLTVWAVVISLYTAVLSLAICGIAGLLASIVYGKAGNFIGVCCGIGAGLLCIGLFIVSILGCIWLTRWILRLSKKALLTMKTVLLKKESVK